MNCIHDVFYCFIEKPVEYIVIILGVLLGVCVVVITAQAVSYYKEEKYYKKGKH